MRPTLEEQPGSHVLERSETSVQDWSSTPMPTRTGDQERLSGRHTNLTDDAQRSLHYRGVTGSFFETRPFGMQLHADSTANSA